MTNETKLRVAAGVLSFIGASFGTWLTSFLEGYRADRQFILQFSEHLLTHRSSIFENCSHALAMQGRAKDLRSAENLENQRIEEWAKAKKPLADYVPHLFTTDLQRELVSIQVEQQTCIQSAAAFFGPKTTAAASAMDNSPETWGAEPINPKLRALFQAMSQEAVYLQKKNFATD
jgi:hypothetical protein